MSKKALVDPQENTPAAKRVYVRQTDFPAASIDDALRVPQAILDHYAGQPSTPFQVGKALDMNPHGTQLRVLTSAARAFGLIEGGAQAASISVSPLARRILRPTEEGDELSGKREALLKPRVFGNFLQRYDGSPLPREDIALNVLEQLDVPRAKGEEVLHRILESARSVGFIEEIKGKSYVALQGTDYAPKPMGSDSERNSNSTREEFPSDNDNSANVPEISQTLPSMLPFADDQRRRRVFITHGKNRELVEPIRKLLDYGELVPVVSVERQSVSKPVPEKVMDDMRGCGAAIIHVDVETIVKDNEGKEYPLLNPNVLIEIGAAMAFYGRRFILLVREGVTLPSNLQGLYEVRYGGDKLDADSAIKLLDAIKDIKNYPLPTTGRES